MIFSKKRKNKGADEQAGLHICCSQTPEDMFSRVQAHFIICHFNELATVAQCPIGKHKKFAAVCFVILGLK